MQEFSGRVLVIATMHRKEQAIAPILESALGVKTLVPANFDTDAFGTFTRDVPRPADQLATAQLKAKAVLEHTGETLAIASEGSFGPHPEMPFVPCNRELLMLVDQDHQLEVVGQVISTETNYRSQPVRSVDEALAFARAVGFPSHGLAVMPMANGESSSGMTKGIITESDLQKALEMAFAHTPSEQVHIETDMRALHNPTRMGVIREATQNLVQTLENRCPTCNCPGFSVVQRRPGLPCQLCQTPTLLTLSLLYRCQRCQDQQEQLFPDGQEFADPGLCPFCNP